MNAELEQLYASITPDGLNVLMGWMCNAAKSQPQVAAELLSFAHNHHVQHSGCFRQMALDQFLDGLPDPAAAAKAKAKKHAKA